MKVSIRKVWLAEIPAKGFRPTVLYAETLEELDKMVDEHFRVVEARFKGQALAKLAREVGARRAAYRRVREGVDG